MGFGHFIQAGKKRHTRNIILFVTETQLYIIKIDLLNKRAIESVPESQKGLGSYSTFFLVPKKDGGFRPILNMRILNVHLIVPDFKIDTFSWLKT